MSFFGVNVTNPFSSAVGQKIEQATDGNLPNENWALNMEICDMINDTEDGPRDAIKAIKKRLNQAAGKNYKIVMYTLIVLETCVKNCGKRFHVLACSREFIQELVKLIGPKNEPPTEIQEKVLNLIQTWAETFKLQPYTQGVVQIYQELKTKGIEFPPTDLESMAPIITPERSVPEVDFGSLGAEGAVAANGASNNQSRPDSYVIRASAQPIHLNEQQMLKLRNELDIVQGNMRVMSEMLTVQSNWAQPGTSETIASEDLELLKELQNTCKAMQERVVDLIGKLDHDELTAELLQINDEMNNLFLRYSRFTKNTAAMAPSELVAQAIGAGGNKKLDAGDSLIDLSDDEGEAAAAAPLSLLERRIGDIGITNQGKDNTKIRRKDFKDGEKDEFEAFAQSRTASFESTKNRPEKANEEDAESKTLRDMLTGQTDKTVTSSEFERFLAERSAASPDISTNQSSSGNGTNIPRQINKEEEKSLFAL